MITPDMKIIMALVRLRGHADFDEVVSWLRDSRQNFLEAGGELLDETQLRRAQGGQKALKDILDMIDRAPTIARSQG